LVTIQGLPIAPKPIAGLQKQAAVVKAGYVNPECAAMQQLPVNCIASGRIHTRLAPILVH
jgi:hypothetical protein